MSGEARLSLHDGRFFTVRGSQKNRIGITTNSVIRDVMRLFDRIAYYPNPPMMKSFKIACLAGAHTGLAQRADAPTGCLSDNATPRGLG